MEVEFGGGEFQPQEFYETQDSHEIHPKTVITLQGTSGAVEFFSRYIGQLDGAHEWLMVAHVDEELRCVHTSCHCGNESAIELPIRQIISDIIEYSSVGIVLAHNHPSGDPHPSESDLRATRRLATVLESLDCTLLDHLILGRGFTSLRRMGLL